MTDMPAGRYENGVIAPWGNPGPKTYDPFRDVKEFMVAMEMTPGLELAVLYAKLVGEEFMELTEAMGDTGHETAVAFYANVLKETADVIYVMAGWTMASDRNEAHEDTLSLALLEGCIMALNTVANLVGWDAIEEAFAEVHRSNMSKLDDDGKPVRREDGKVLKGPNYSPADLTDLASRVVLKLNRGN